MDPLTPISASPPSSSSDALVGDTGFVGTSLLRQTHFAGRFRSNNIREIQDSPWDEVVCAAAPGAKWIANQHPDADRANIESLIAHLDRVQCRHFTLVSTVDVFDTPVEVDETTPVEEDRLQPYGLHRRLLEKFVASRFENYLIARLPGLVGPGLRKNVIFDFLNGNNLHLVDSRGVFQFYPMVNLWSDLQLAIRCELQLVHLTAEPISVSDVASEGFGVCFDQANEQVPVRYDFRSIHAGSFGGRGSYQYSRRESIQAIRAYAQTEPRS